MSSNLSSTGRFNGVSIWVFRLHVKYKSFSIEDLHPHIPAHNLTDLTKGRIHFRGADTLGCLNQQAAFHLYRLPGLFVDCFIAAVFILKADGLGHLNDLHGIGQQLYKWLSIKTASDKGILAVCVRWHDAKRGYL